MEIFPLQPFNFIEESFYLQQQGHLHLSLGHLHFGHVHLFFEQVHGEVLHLGHFLSPIKNPFLTWVNVRNYTFYV